MKARISWVRTEVGSAHAHSRAACGKYTTVRITSKRVDKFNQITLNVYYTRSVIRQLVGQPLLILNQLRSRLTRLALRDFVSDVNAPAFTQLYYLN